VGVITKKIQEEKKSLDVENKKRKHFITEETFEEIENPHKVHLIQEDPEFDQLIDEFLLYFY
jgi:hypothetical protein